MCKDTEKKDYAVGKEDSGRMGVRERQARLERYIGSGYKKIMKSNVYSSHDNRDERIWSEEEESCLHT